MKGYKKILCLFIAMFVSFSALCGPTIYATEDIKQTEVSGIVKTPWRDGDLKKSLRLDWLPMIRKMAAGKVSGDKYTWDFDNSPLYLDKTTDEAASAVTDFTHYLSDVFSNPAKLTRLVGETDIGLFSIGGLGFKMKTKEVKASGKKVMRCALTEICVEHWRSPYGDNCSREQATSYYNKCQKQIKVVVKKVIKARQKSGQPLSKAQKLKYIHDWLITSVEYDYKGLKAKNVASVLEGNKKYSYLYNEYGALVDGLAVCQGYAYAFKAIVDELVRQTKVAIQCDVAAGQNHVWNLVLLNKKWYVVDVTLDDNSKKDFYNKETETSNFLVSDNKHNIRVYTTNSGAGPANSRKYEGAKWPRFKMPLNVCKVTLKNQNKVYRYKKGKQIIPEVVVKYGRNVIPKGAYKVIRTEHNKTGTAKIKVVPSKKCTALNGNLKGPSFKIKASK